MYEGDEHLINMMDSNRGLANNSQVINDEALANVLRKAEFSMDIVLTWWELLVLKSAVEDIVLGAAVLTVHGKTFLIQIIWHLKNWSN